VVANALSRRPYLALNGVMALPRDLCEVFYKIEINVVRRENKSVLCTLEVQPTLVEEIRVAQTADPQLERIREEVLTGKAPGFVIHEDGALRFHNRVCVPAVEDLKRRILDKGHNTLHSVHPGGNKLYKDLK